MWTILDATCVVSLLNSKAVNEVHKDSLHEYQL